MERFLDLNVQRSCTLFDLALHTTWFIKQAPASTVPSMTALGHCISTYTLSLEQDFANTSRMLICAVSWTVSKAIAEFRPPSTRTRLPRRRGPAKNAHSPIVSEEAPEQVPGPRGEVAEGVGEGNISLSHFTGVVLGIERDGCPKAGRAGRLRERWGLSRHYDLRGLVRREAEVFKVVGENWGGGLAAEWKEARRMSSG
ncbi:MAG: hypothetical protein Q9173_002870 [Seirophora scorigena]